MSLKHFGPYPFAVYPVTGMIASFMPSKMQLLGLNKFSFYDPLIWLAGIPEIRVGIDNLAFP
jgi:hypothetical protein